MCDLSPANFKRSAHRPPMRDKAQIFVPGSLLSPNISIPSSCGYKTSTHRQEERVIDTRVNPSPSANSLQTQETNHVSPLQMEKEAIKSIPYPSAKQTARLMIVYGEGGWRKCVYVCVCLVRMVQLKKTQVVQKKKALDSTRCARNNNSNASEKYCRTPSRIITCIRSWQRLSR